MSTWCTTLLTDLYIFLGQLLSPEKLHQHFETAITSWPFALMIIAIVFRTQIAHLISTMRRLSYKDASRELSASWEEDLQNLEIIKQKTETSKTPPSPQSTHELDRLMELSKISKRSAIIEAWLSVETAAKELATTPDEGARPLTSPLAVERELWRRELISPGEREMLARLRNLRNQASHMKDFDIEDEDAAAYIDTALSLAAQLHRLKEKQ